MTRKRLTLALLSITLLIATNLRAEEPSPPKKAPNFRLLDQRGTSHELYRQADVKGVVLLAQSVGDPVSRENYAAFEQLRKAHKNDIRFFLLDVSSEDSTEAVNAALKEGGVKARCLMDVNQIVARTLGLTRTGETILIDTKNWNIVYRGALNASLENSIQQLLAGTVQTVNEAPAAGREIDYAAWQTPVDYATDVAPILINKCVPCHNKNGAGPFALDSHKAAAGWAKMMREVLLTDRMPPWSADPAIGHFSNDMGITPEEKRTLIKWIDLGAGGSGGEDPLEAHTPPPAEKWKLGEPDQVLTLPDPFTVPAEGAVEYQLIEVPTGLTEDRWLRGMEVRPGNAKVVHHCLVFIKYPEDRKHLEPQVSAGAKGFFAGFVPGAEPAFFPEGTGKFIPAGSTLLFQIHYVTIGKEELDQTEMALYFLDEPPPLRMVTEAAYKADFEIPPGDPDYSVVADHNFGSDITLYALAPHMHYRGSRMKYTAVYPDKTTETLLSVPNYNFDWQHAYWLAEPKVLPKGTRIVCTGAFDNSAQNPYNPDPTATVHFGDQTWEEMFIGYIAYAAPREEFTRHLENRQKHLDKARARFREEHPEAFEGEPLTEGSIIDTLWRENEWKFRFKADGVLLVNDLIKGKWAMKDQKVTIDVVGTHYELDVIGNGLYFNGSYPIDRIEE